MDNVNRMEMLGEEFSSKQLLFLAAKELIGRYRLLFGSFSIDWACFYCNKRL